jgi:general secretion pathway protein D
MKKLILSLIATAVAGLLVTAGAQPVPGDNNNDTNNAPLPGQQDGTTPDAGGPPPMPPDASGGQAAPADDTGTGDRPVVQPLVITPTQSRHAGPGTIQSDFMPPTQAGTNPDELHLNFHNAPLEMVLNYLSDAAGFIIVMDTHVNGNVTIISSHPVTRPEAINLLNAELNKNGYAAIRTDDRTLTIVDKNDAKTSDIPVKSGNDPDQIPKNAEIVTQIIPIRFVEARQLVSDLTSFVSPQATVVANEAGNSIVITDTQENIRHLVEIIKAIDSSAEAETEIRVFPLKYASPTDVASELSSVFPSGNSSGGNTQSPIRFGGGGGFARFFGGGGGRGGGADNSQNDRIKKETQVSAVADSRIQAVIVTAPKDLMDEIGEMMTQLDVPSDRDQNVYVFKMKNGDPQQVAQVLQNMFQSSTSSRGSSQTTTATGDALQTRINNNTTSTGSTTTGSSGFGGTIGGAGRTGGGGF